MLKLRSEDDLSDVRINDDLIVLSHSVQADGGFFTS